MALLYAYSTAGDYTNQEENPIKLVISEAGPTDLYAVYPNAGSDYKNTWRNLLGDTTLTDSELQEEVKEISPYYVLYDVENEELNINESLIPYTILAYGNGIPCPGGVLGDDTVPFSQSTAIYNALGESKCIRFELNGIHHNQFIDDGDNDYEDTVFPGSTDDMVHGYYYGKEENGTLGLQQLINRHLFGNN